MLLHFLMSSFLSLLHPYHVSQTNVNYNDKEQIVEVSVKIFTEDFEQALRKACKCKIELMKDADKSLNEQEILAYISKNLQINVNGNSTSLQMIGFEKEAESIWSYFEIRNISSVSKIEITNKLLYDFHINQENLLHLKVNGKEMNGKLGFPATRYSSEF